MLRDIVRAIPGRGILETIIGALVGAAVLGPIGAGVALPYASAFVPEAELEAVGIFVVGLAVGVWIGAVAG